MTYLLRSQRTQENYFEKLTTKAVNTRKNFEFAVTNFNRFCAEKFDDRNSEEIIQEIMTLKGEEREQALYDVLQNWINWNLKRKIAASTIHNNFSYFKNYLHYRGLKITSQDIKENLNLPKVEKEEKHPLSLTEIQRILEAANFSKKPLYLALLSSGMRIGEAVQIRKRDLDLSLDRIMVKIPAKITKTKSGRTVFLSKEASDFIKPKLRKIEDDGLVWGTNEDPSNAIAAEEMAFRRYLEKTGLTETYQTTRTRKITLHSFRAYFFTRAARVHDENYAHKMTGHGGYLMQYDRLTDEEKFDLYLELEPELLIFDLTKKDAEIKKLKDANRKLEEYAKKVDELWADKQRMENNKEKIKNRIPLQN